MTQVVSEAPRYINLLVLVSNLPEKFEKLGIASMSITKSQTLKKNTKKYQSEAKSPTFLAFFDVSLKCQIMNTQIVHIKHAHEQLNNNEILSKKIE